MLLSFLLALATFFANHPRPSSPRYEEAQIRSQVDPAPASARACSPDAYPQTGWTRLSAGVEGISYAIPPGFPRPAPYRGGSTVLGFVARQSSHFGVHWAKTPEWGSSGYRVELNATKHDYSWCRESLAGREMVVVAYKVTTGDTLTGENDRTYVVRAIWGLRPGVWLSFNGYVPSLELQTELLAVIRTFRVDSNAPSRKVQIPTGYWYWAALQAVDSGR